jgi:Fe-S-cluster containining protein
MPTLANSSRQDALRDQAGHVHLAIHRDPASGAAALRLSAPLFEAEWQDEITTSTVTTAAGVLKGCPSPERVFELTQRVMDSTSRLVAGFLARAPQGAVACRAGCDHCCHVVVGVTPPEALTIFEHVKRTFSSEAFERLRQRVAEFLELTRALSSSARFAPEYPCVFLEDGCCSIYEVRPLACRGMNSLDATECESRLRDPEARRAFAANGGGRLFLEPVRAFRAISAGLQLGIAELYRLDMRPLELTAAMQVLLEGGTSVLDAWLAGKHPFTAALCNPLEE